MKFIIKSNNKHGEVQMFISSITSPFTGTDSPFEFESEREAREFLTDYCTYDLVVRYEDYWDIVPVNSVSAQSQPVIDGEFLNPELIIWNLISFTGGTANDRAKFSRMLKADGYSKGFIKGIYMRHNPTKEIADKHRHEFKGIKVTTIQITDKQFGQITTTY